MSSLIENFRDADGQAVQPYFAAFMLLNGYTRARQPWERDGHNCEYMEWSRCMWERFERENGHPVDHETRNTRAPQFTEWLNGLCLDVVARSHVEAA